LSALHMTHSCVTRPFRMCDLTHTFVWHDVYTRMTWLNPICDITPQYVWHDTFMQATWLIHTRHVTQILQKFDKWRLSILQILHSYGSSIVVDLQFFKKTVWQVHWRVKIMEKFQKNGNFPHSSYQSWHLFSKN